MHVVQSAVAQESRLTTRWSQGDWRGANFTKSEDGNKSKVFKNVRFCAQPQLIVNHLKSRR